MFAISSNSGTARGTSRNLTVEGFAGFEVMDKVLGYEFFRFPGCGREALSILWRNQVGIGLQGSAFRSFYVNALTGIDLVFKGVQDFEGSTVYGRSRLCPNSLLPVRRSSPDKSGL